MNGLGLGLAALQGFVDARDGEGWVEMLHGGAAPGWRPGRRRRGDRPWVEHHWVDRWLTDADPVDLRLLARCTGPVIDIGCGPGRLTAALHAAGVRVLGVDISRQSVALTRDRGGPAMCGDVFAGLPDEGRWQTALLVDGNIGIGGDPVRLLRRLTRVVRHDGRLLVEVSRADVDHRGVSRIRYPDGRIGRPFPWAVLGRAALDRAAAASGWHRAEAWLDGEREFVLLTGGAATA